MVKLFCTKKLAAKSHEIYLQKCSTIEAFGDIVKKSIHFKDIFQVMYNFFCLYSYHEYFILSLKSEKRVTERNKRLCPEKLVTERNKILSL